MRIAMTGNPNSGKTTMYNALTGRSEHVGNWAGVTVDKKEYPVKKTYYEGEGELIAVDLPGAYSMSPFTSEESITSSYVKNEHPDVIINIVDATNLSRSLFFTTQLLELGIPVVVALNKSDVNEKKENRIDEKTLSEKLGCPVIKTVSTQTTGLKEVIKEAVSLAGAGAGQKAPYHQPDIDLTNKKEVEEADRKRFDFVNGVVAKVETRKTLTKEQSKDDTIDKIITHPVLGIIVFAAVMWLVFFISQSTVGTWLSELLAGWIEIFQEWVAGKVENASPILQSILVDGIIGGVGAVVGFLPLVMVMYFLIALLEDCGYMARATVVLDPIFKRVGLSGKSVIPMVIGTGCGVPAIMACRTIKNERERRATALLCTFMPCGAKLPVIALFAGAFFPDAKWVGPVMYFVGIGLILLGALLIKQITGMKYRKSFFIMELPEYKAPSFVFALKSMLERGKAYIVKAGTIILVCNTVVQVMASFTPSFAEAAEDSSDSILAIISAPVATLLIPIVGFACWQCAAAAVTGFIAKENVVGTLATVFAITNFIDTEELELIGSGSEVAAIMGLTKVAALAYLMFNLYTPPCFAALGAMNSEMKSGKWLAGAICFQLATGYVIGFLVYQIGTLITTGSLGAGFVGGLIATLLIAAVIAYLCVNANKKVKAEYELKAAA
ncbi:MAG: ferrous iron transporter B [Butyrivibrio sp.]|nr:ferrous iron transporter B [Muribaculum sp.]MCM1552947.1 ferrous iron transporter B [Butyrivibrio sp.]